MQLLRVCRICLLLLLFFSAHAAWSSELSGRLVTNILFQDERGNPWPEAERFHSLIVTERGRPFSRESVRSDIEYLYLKGIFRDVRVDAFPEDGGVKLVYTLFPLTIVDKVVVHGSHAVSKGRIKGIVSRLEGRPLREDMLPEVRIDIITMYQAEGYFDVDVRFRREDADRPYRVILHVDIDESGPTIVERIEFKGNKFFSDMDLRSVMKTEEGRPIKRDVLFDSDLEAIKKLYAEAGYPAARVDVVNMNFRDRKVSVTISGEEGPRVGVEFRGNRAIGSRRLMRSLLIWSERNVSDAVIDSSADKIKEMYRKKGYADVEVEVKKIEGEDRLDLVFEIMEGPRVTVDKITIEGNIAFSDRELKKGMTMRESGWLKSRPYVEDILDKDIDGIKDRYIDAGYLDVHIKKETVRSADGRKASISIVISEGSRAIVGAISFEGNTVFGDDELMSRLVQRQGQGFSERSLEEDRYRILHAYSQKGYIYAKVAVETRDAGAPMSGKRGVKSDPKEGELRPAVRVLDIFYRITEDRPVTIGRVILRGNDTTKDQVILRELLTKQGDTYNYEEILKSQQRIYRLGYFGLARIEPLRPAEKGYVKDLLLTVEEMPAGAVDVGIGYGDLDRMRGFVEISHRNIGGMARTGSLRLEMSDILQRAVFSFREPWLLNRRLDSRLTLSWSDSERINADTREIYYETRRATAAFGIEHAWNALKLSLLYQYENVENYNVQPGASLFPEDEGRVRISSLSPGLILDMRDDPFNPRSGSLHGIVVKEAMSAIGSETDFTKVTAQSSWFFPLSERLIAAASLRAGMAWPHRDTREMPLHERFYAGGSTTIRGYLQDLVGPTRPGTGGDPVPTGGESMVIGNLEFRINPAGTLGIVLFSDAGGVWQERTIRVNDLRASYGAGIRYNTPVGPFRLDYGQKIHRRSGEAPGELHFSLGHAF